MDETKTGHLRFAIIPTNGRHCLDDAVEAIQPQVDKVILINTTKAGLFQFPMRSNTIDQLYGDETINISRWWNQGLNHAAWWASHVRRKQKLDSVTWDVAIINDDVIVPEGWVQAVAQNMREHNAVAGCTGDHDIVLRTTDIVHIRMQGFAFVLKGEHGMRANELFTWYYTDNYIDWESRLAGGMAMMRGFPVQHLYPNGQVTPQIHVQIAEDAANFYASYGRMPH